VKILIVDDDLNSRRLLITDWMMPGIDGMELIRLIRSTQAEGYTYIIMLTALATKPQVVSGLESGADDYLTKPFDPDELLARITIGQRILQLEERLMESRRQMEILAMQDTLTGLFNRRAIHDRALAELNRLARGTASAPLSVILLDVDRFKTINDNYGHEAGDRALQVVAERLGQMLRSYDLVGRWGGEEFLVLLPGTGLAEACVVAERVRAGLAQSAVPVEGGGAALTASLGVASVGVEVMQAAGSDEPWLDRLMRAADRALYQAKNSGRNKVCVADEVTAH
jgi:two-component system chemotaxis response regulator CheY